MVKAFNATFGDNEYDLEAWGRMCVLVGMKSIPKDLEARKLVRISLIWSSTSNPLALFSWAAILLIRFKLP